MKESKIHKIYSVAEKRLSWYCKSQTRDEVLDGRHIARELNKFITKLSSNLRSEVGILLTESAVMQNILKMKSLTERFS